MPKKSTKPVAVAKTAALSRPTRSAKPRAIVPAIAPTVKAGSGTAASSTKKRKSVDYGDEMQDVPAVKGSKRSRVAKDVESEVVPKLRALKLQTKNIGGQSQGEDVSPSSSTGRGRGRVRKVTFVPNQAPSDVMKLFFFGDGDMGALGLGPKTKEVPKPKLNTYLDPSKPSTFDVVQMECGALHCIALTKDNRILTWGVNDNHALGRDTTWDGEKLHDMDAAAPVADDVDDLNPLESIPTPIPASSFPPGTNFVQVAAADSLSLALTVMGLVYAWGTFRNSEGHSTFGYSETGEHIISQKTPTLVPALSAITSIACGSDHCLALSSTGALYAWGIHGENRLGRRVSPRHIADAFTPHLVEIKAVKSIFSGFRHSFAVDAKDNVWAWGLNSYGQAGSNPGGAGSAAAVYLDRPRKVTALCGKGVKSMAGGASHSASIAADGQCYLWGRVDVGQLGIQFTDAQLSDDSLIRRGALKNEPRICLQPTRITVPGLENVASVSCGTDHTIFVNKEGAAFSSGFSSQGQLGLLDEDGDPECEDVMVARQIRARNTVLKWAGAGANFSALGSLYQGPKGEAAN